MMPSRPNAHSSNTDGNDCKDGAPPNVYEEKYELFLSPGPESKEQRGESSHLQKRIYSNKKESEIK